jgi:hypothetical protein
MRLCCDSLRSCPALPQQTVFSFACLLRLPPHPRPNNPTHTDNSLSKHNTHMSTAILHAPATIPRLGLPPPPPPPSPLPPCALSTCRRARAGGGAVH